MTDHGSPARELRKSWDTDPRWRGVTREYTPEDVVRLRPTILV
jgi:isocitrate lyase